MSEIFISYSHEDKEYVHKLVDSIKDRGIDAWIDDRIDHGARWPKVIEEKLENCKVLVLVMTSNSSDSDWVQKELTRALRKKKMILPLLLEGDEPWFSVENIQYEDVTDGKLPPERFYNRLTSLSSKSSGYYKIDWESFSAEKQELEDGYEIKKKDKIDEIRSGIKNWIPKKMTFLLKVGSCELRYRLGHNPYKANLFVDSSGNQPLTSLENKGWTHNFWGSMGSFHMDSKPESMYSRDWDINAKILTIAKDLLYANLTIGKKIEEIEVKLHKL